MWFQMDQDRHRELLRGANAQTLIVPVAVQEGGLDRATRSQMTAELTAAFGGAGAGARLDAYAVQRAFGDGLRTTQVGKLDSISNELGVTRRLIVQAGHDRQGNLKVNVTWATRPDRSAFWQLPKTTSFSFPMGASAPAEVFREKAIPAIAGFIGVTPVSITLRKPPTELPRLPADLARLEAMADASPFNEALAFQLLGALAPRQPVRTREQLHERALLKLRALDGSDWRVRFLLARAHLNLNNRPAAVALLADARQPAEKALLAAANGSLPALEREVGLVKEELFRLMLELDLQALRREYRVPIKEPVPAFIGKTVAQDGIWWPLFERRLADGDGWQVQMNLQLKVLLDRVLPVEGLNLEAQARGLQALGKDIDPDALGATVLEHVNRLRSADVKVRACAREGQSCVRTGYLDLMESSAVANFVKSITRAGVMQASYERAEEQARSLAKYLDGQPDFAVAVSRVILEGAQRMTPENRNRLMKVQIDSALVAAHWEQEQSLTSRQALVSMGVPSSASIPFLMEYADDLPPRDFWFSGFSGYPEAAMAARRGRAFHSVTNVAPVIEVLSLPTLAAGDKEVLTRDLADRFQGHPERQTLLALHRPAQTDAASAGPSSGAAAKLDPLEEEFKAALRDRAHDWNVYRNHGRRLIEERGAYKEALAVFMQFPGFTDGRGYNRVGLSNWAYDAGSMLFWRGAIEEARPLLKIAADLQTGSAASMGSASRLDLLNRRFGEAMAGSLARGSRYDDPYAYRDYLGWLFATGDSKTAWAGFEQLSGKLDNPQVWLAATAGLQKDGRTWPQVRDWLLAEARRSVVLGGEKPALATAVAMSVVDRRPADDLVQVMKQIEGEPTTAFEPPLVTKPHPVTGYAETIPPSGLTNRLDPSLKAGKVNSHLVMFADAWLSLQREQYAEATEKFYQMALYYPVEGISFQPNYSYALSYFARAAAKSGDSKGLSEFLEKRTVSYFERFDNHLARAVFAGVKGNHDSAITHLKTAFNYRPYTERRPIFTEYQWAETCEWLFEQTRDPRYRDLVLPWLKAHQKIQPTYAWAYAMEAKLAPLEADRLKALGAALYLDPLSQRAAVFPEATRAKAAKAFAANNPFKLNGAGSGKASDRAAKVRQS